MQGGKIKWFTIIVKPFIKRIVAKGAASEKQISN
jgi:hypothetical protein